MNNLRTWMLTSVSDLGLELDGVVLSVLGTTRQLVGLAEECPPSAIKLQT